MSSTQSFPASAATRRDVLRWTAAVAATLPVAGALSAWEPAPMNQWIDAHSHIWTRDVKNFPLAKGQTVDDLKPASFTAEEALALMKPFGVNRVVLIQHHIYHGWDNTYLIDAARRYPDAFRVVGMVDDTQPHPDATMRKLLPQRVTAFRITSLIRGADKWLDGPGMDAMWKCAAETKQAMCCLINPDDLPAVDKMCAKHPQTPVVIDHFARIGMTGKIDEADVKNLLSLAKHPLAVVKISAYYALGQKKPPYVDMLPLVRKLYDAFGPQRLMWASDCPYQLGEGHSYEASLAVIRDRADFLSADDKQWVLRKTAEKVYAF